MQIRWQWALCMKSLASLSLQLKAQTLNFSLRLNSISELKWARGSVTEENKYSNGQFLLLTLPPPLTPSYNLNFWHHNWLLWHLETVRIIKYKTVTFCKVKNGKQIERSSKNSFEINKPISKQTLDLIVGYPILKGKGDSLKTREHSGQKARSPRYDKPRPFVKS